MRYTIALILGLLPLFLNAQVKIDDVGDGWKSQVEKAIVLIEQKDPENYKFLLEHCNHIEFIIGDRSTTKLPTTIAITVRDMKIGSINNIAAILIHESFHLYVAKNALIYAPEKEEHLAYTREYEFLCRLENVEDWLFINAMNQIIKLQK
jgi:hypothetical protein